jgi:hypothetical protein
VSQIYKSLVSGPVPPSVPTSFVTDVNSPSVPIANVENIKGGSSTANTTNGIQTDGSSGSNTITIQLTNRATGSVTTTGAVTSPIITLPLGATPGVYTFDISVAGFAKTGIGSPLGAGFTIVGSIRTTGASAVLIPTQAVDHFEEGAMAGSSALLGVSGNNAVVNVTGVSDGAAGFVIDWQATLSYTFAS